MKPANPYSDLLPFHFWKRAVAGVAPDQLDPVVKISFKIEPATKVATAGSCFAQHIAREMRARGLSYFATEEPHPVVPPELHESYSYGLFSARYGNIYTTRQLLQLFQRAYGKFQPGETAWRTAQGEIVDPFRPNIQPGGFASLEDLAADRAHHLARVRELFEKLDCFVFTLGLTEGWEGIADRAAYPVCPALFDPEFGKRKYRFVNYSVAKVQADLQAFIDALRSVNPQARVILTVSPVPLVATYERRHVLCSTTYSKSVLRVAAEEISRANKQVDYFPSYEIITGAYSRGRYFAEDLRSVTAEGVAHVMRVFFRHYVGKQAGRSQLAPAKAAASRRTEEFQRLSQRVNEVLCDEELLDQQPPAA